jgi:hypothetical protein
MDRRPAARNFAYAVGVVVVIGFTLMKGRSIIALLLLAAWTAIPALACLPTHEMSKAEMACCKKMAGNCRMSASQHPCCKTAKSTVAPDARVENTVSHVLPLPLVAFAEVVFLPEVTPDPAFTSKLGLPPPAPPGLNSILRI